MRALLTAAELQLLEALANDTGALASAGRLRRAEQDLLLVRLAADTGARRGELAALHVSDLTGRALTICRALSAGVVTTPKSGRSRTLTVGASTAAMWNTLIEGWTKRSGEPVGPWLFSAHADHRTRLGAEALGHRFDRFDRVRDAAGIPDATLHRLRHSVATFLVAHGQILQAQARLGHADPSITLRVYAHALPDTDYSVADAIDDHLHPQPNRRPPADAARGTPSRSESSSPEDAAG